MTISAVRRRVVEAGPRDWDGRRLAAPFAPDGAYGAPWQRVSYRTSNVRNPV